MTQLNATEYHTLHQQSIEQPDQFWAEQATRFITWFQPWRTVTSGDFEHANVSWFNGGKLNACYNCIDKHLPTKANQIALIWEGNEPNETKHITYQALHTAVCQFANVLKKQGIKKGDRVCLYLPMIPEAVYAMLACARIGAIHSVIFAGFSPNAIQARLADTRAKLIITADQGRRGNKVIPLKENIDAAIKECAFVDTVLVVQHTRNTIPWEKTRDKWYHEEKQMVESDCPVEKLDANDPLFILYTSGSTGKPKGILHATGGYLVYAAMTHHYVFDYQADDIHWCTADVGWITGHSYTLYGPLANGATTIIYEGTPNYPDFGRFWEIIDKHRVTTFYTAPTAIRALRREGDKWLANSSRDSLRILGSVGEPINPEVWEWYYHQVGNGRCPIVDTWWQTETGGILLSPLPGTTPLKPGAASWPFFGILPAVVDDQGNELPPEQAGRLVIKQPWPGLMMTIYGDKQRYKNTYLADIPGCYLTGDGAKCDDEGYYWITGRNDDVIKIAGHRIGTEEVESAFLTHSAVSEAAVVPIPDELKGQSIHAFITIKEGINPSDALKNELVQHVRNTIGAIATPKTIQWTPDLPKTRSGKIMRRILRKIACHDLEQLGDTSTLANPDVIDALIKRIKTAE